MTTDRRTVLKDLAFDFIDVMSLLILVCLIELVMVHLLGVSFYFSDLWLAVAGSAAAALLAALGFAGLRALAPGGLVSRRDARLVLAAAIPAYLLLLFDLKPFTIDPGLWRLSTLGLVLLAAAVAAPAAAAAWSVSRLSPDRGAGRTLFIGLVLPLGLGAASALAHGIDDKNLLSLLLLAVLAAVGLLGLLLFRVPAASRVGGLLNHRGLKAGLIVAVTAASLFAARRETAREREPSTADYGAPSIIMITVDTLRYDYQFINRGSPGADPNTGKLPPLVSSSPFAGSLQVPAIEGLARDGIRFDHAMSPSTWTPTGVAGLITGLYPRASGAGILIPGEPYDFTGPLDSCTTIAESLHQAGYVTAAVVDSPWLYPSRGYAQGFNYYRMKDDFTRPPRFLLSRAWHLIESLQDPYQVMPATQVTDMALHWLRHRPAGPFFLWVHYLDPHLPYYEHEKYPTQTPPGPMDERLALRVSPVDVRSRYFGFGPTDQQFFKERYYGEVRFTDDEIGRLLAELKSQGLYDESLIALSADHGEELWDHGGFEHGHSFHDEILHVPLIFKLPGNARRGSEVSAWVSTSRLGATLLDLAHVKAQFPGASLKPCLESGACGRASQPDGWWYAENVLYGSERGAVGTVDGKKVILHHDLSTSCYDLAADPAELRPLPPEQCAWPVPNLDPKQTVAKIIQYNLTVFQRLRANQQTTQEPGREEFQHLKALGYVQ